MNFWRLVLTLASKDLKQRYQMSWFNFGLSIMQPVFHAAVFTLVFSKITQFGSEGRPYAAFSLAALVPWAYLTGCVRGGASSLSSNVPIITRLRFPREAIPLSTVLALSVPFVLNLVVLAAVFHALGVPVGLSAFPRLLPVFALQAALGAGLALHLAVIAVYVGAVRSVLSAAMQAWLLISPVVYSLERVPEEWLGAYRLNPMVGIIEAYRATLLHDRTPDYGALLPAVIAASILLSSGVLVFRALERNVADHL